MDAGSGIVNVLNEKAVAAIGPPTADVLRKYGVAVDVMPERFTFEDMVDAVQETLK